MRCDTNYQAYSIILSSRTDKLHLINTKGEVIKISAKYISTFGKIRNFWISRFSWMSIYNLYSHNKGPAMQTLYILKSAGASLSTSGRDACDLRCHEARVRSLHSHRHIISLALCKTAVTPLLTHWNYYSLALSHRYYLRMYSHKYDCVLAMLVGLGSNIGNCR